MPALHLPSETWADIFGFCGRPHLGQSIAPSCVHFWRLSTAQMALKKCTRVVAPIVLFHDRVGQIGPQGEFVERKQVPQCPPPHNLHISKVSVCCLCCVDEHLLSFVRMLSAHLPCALHVEGQRIAFEGQFGGPKPPMRRHLRRLAPILGNAHSVRLLDADWAHLLGELLADQRTRDAMLKVPRLECAHIVGALDQVQFGPLLEWLLQPLGEDFSPNRQLHLKFGDCSPPQFGILAPFIWALRRHFACAFDRQSPFVVHFFGLSADSSNFVAFKDVNCATGQMLVLKKAKGGALLALELGFSGSGRAKKRKMPEEEDLENDHKNGGIGMDGEMANGKMVSIHIKC